MIPAGGNRRAGSSRQLKSQRLVVEGCVVGKHKSRQCPEALAYAVEAGPSIGQAKSKPLMHVSRKMLEQLLLCVCQPRLNLLIELGLQLGKGGVDLVGGPAALINREDAILEINARLDRAEHIVRRAKHSAEERKLLSQQFEHSLVGLIPFVQKVDHDNVVLLAVAVAAADSLLNTLRVPRQVVVHDQRAKLHVHAFCRCFGRQHDRCVVTEVLDEGGAQVDRA